MNRILQFKENFKENFNGAGQSNDKIDLPLVRGIYQRNYPLGRHSFFKTGGNADVLYQPLDTEDLVQFLINKPHGLPITIIGNLSNTLVTDKGVPGIVIDLRRFQNIRFYNNTVEVDSGVQLSQFINTCVKRGISCCEYLYMIPGTIGGALYMNAGVPDFEIKDVVQSIKLLDINTGSISQMSYNGMSYRSGNIPDDKIIISCILKIHMDNKEYIERVLQKIHTVRLAKQPIGARTCGCTFKNPPNNRAWKLIKDAGCSEMSVGEAVVSPIHSNFIINRGSATSADILALISNIKWRVYKETGVILEEEIRIIGEL